MRYSIFNLVREAIAGHGGWPAAWRRAEPRASYDAVIVGGGGHGLASAWHLAKDHGLKVAVVEKAWLGAGNTGRNTTVIRSNYLREPGIRFQDENLRLWTDLSAKLDFNLMVSHRGQLEILQTWARLRDSRRRMHAMRWHGADYRLLGPDQVYALLPTLNRDPSMRLPILGGAWQGRAGTVRHDAVAWAYARAASEAGVDIVEACDVKGLMMDAGAVTGLITSRGDIRCERVGLAVAGNSGRIAGMAGLRLPIETLALQAFVSEPLKPVLDIVVTVPALAMYLSQSDKGELVIGGGADAYPSYAQRGAPPLLLETVAAMIEMFPHLARVKMLRHWAGAIDLSYDTSPIVSDTRVRGLFVSTGWGSGGFKSIPAGGRSFARLIATGKPDDWIAPFSLARFDALRPVFETASASNRF